MPFVEQYAAALTVSDAPQSCNQHISTFLDEYVQDRNITVCVAVGYNKKNEVKVAGFSIGYAGILLYGRSCITSSTFDYVEVCDHSVVPDACFVLHSKPHKESVSYNAGSIRIPNAVLQNVLARKVLLIHSDRIPSDLESNSQLYEQVKKNIRSFDVNVQLKQSRDAFLEAAEKIRADTKDSNPSLELLHTMVLVESHMMDPKNVSLRKKIKEQAQIASAKKSLLWKALGGALMVLGVALMAVGCVGIAASLGSGVGALGALPSAGIFGAGVGLFAAGSGMARHGVVPSVLEKASAELIAVNGT